MNSSGYYMVSLTELIRTYGKDGTSSILRTFVPLTDTRTADYLYNDAIQMEIRDLSRTYLRFRMNMILYKGMSPSG